MSRPTVAPPLDPAAPTGRVAEDQSDATSLLAAVGGPQGAAVLLPGVYDELRKVAAAWMASEAPGHTLDATALVNEAYLRLAGDQRFATRAHFFAAAGEAMRRILVDAARRKAAGKRGGRWARVELGDIATDTRRDTDLLALNDALGRLEAESPEEARVVKLRHFTGMTIEQAADALGISVRTANRHWTYARARLRQLLGGGGVSVEK